MISTILIHLDVGIFIELENRRTEHLVKTLSLEYFDESENLKTENIWK